MSRTALKLTAAAAAILTGGLGLAACSDSTDTADTADSADTTVIDAGDATIATGGAGEWSASVDGAAIEIEDATVVCAEQGGNLSLTVASTTTGDATGLSAVLTTGDNPEVQAVGMGSTETGEATATKDGDTYTITGTLTAADMNNPMAGPQEKSFELEVTCP